MMNFSLIILGKLVLFLCKTLNLGSGSTWPGHITLEANSNFVRDMFKKNPNLKVIFIAGTNGKTTTSLLLQNILQQADYNVFRNEAGANLLNGIASSLIENSSIFGKLKHDIAIFETDENNFPLAIKQVTPFAVLLLNLFRDQLDRYGEVNTVASKWDEALSQLPKQTMIFTNGDDPKLSSILKNSRKSVYYFALNSKFMEAGKTPYDVDFTYCPKCQTKLEYSKVSYSHLGKFKCLNCKFTNPKSETFSNLTVPLFGGYNIYNVNAAALVAKCAFGISEKTIRTALKKAKPAFGRQEVVCYNDRNVLILLSKNPAGFNQSIEAVRALNKNGNILLALNDRVPDGRDVSWIWDVDFENIPEASKIFVSGDRAYDIALRIKYLSINNRQSLSGVFDNLRVAIKTAIEQTERNETLYVFPTYSAMLEVRNLLVGRKLL